MYVELLPDDVNAVLERPFVGGCQAALGAILHQPPPRVLADDIIREELF